MRKSLLILITLVALGISGAGVSVHADGPPLGCYYGDLHTPGYVCSGGVCCPDGLRYEAPTGSVDGAVDLVYGDVPGGQQRLDTFDAGITSLLLEYIF